VVLPPAEVTHSSDTTLSSAAATSSGPRASHRVTAAVASAAVVAITGLVVWRVGIRRAETPPPQQLAAPPPATADATVAPAEPPLVGWLEAANPFVAWHGGQWLAHQVTRREYRQFLESLPVSDALRFQPVTGWDDRDPMRPVAWVTFERAAAFLPRDPRVAADQRAMAGRGRRRLGARPGGIGRPGPLQEWTSTVRDGLVVVCGGLERMSPVEQAAAASDPLMKSSEALAGPSPAPTLSPRRRSGSAACGERRATRL